MGAFCSLGPEILIGLGIHPLQYVSTYPGFYAPDLVSWSVRISFMRKKYHLLKHAPIIIGSDVWIGARAIVRDGVNIGHGAVIGAGALVTKDVAPYSIVGGVPARLIRMRFSDDIVARAP